MWIKPIWKRTAPNPPSAFLAQLEQLTEEERMGKYSNMAGAMAEEYQRFKKGLWKTQ